MNRPLVDALRGMEVEKPPVWIMRQAGRHLPEYRSLRERHSFQECVTNPDLAAEITLQPIRRYAMDGAVIFADIMTPLEAMGVDVTFDPGPSLVPHDIDQVAALPNLDPGDVAFIVDTISAVRSAVPNDTAVIGFAGAPTTLLAYLTEGGGSKDFMGLRGALRAQPDTAAEALDRLAREMNRYLRIQVDAGADVVQLFDTWAGLLDRDTYARLAAPAARTALEGIDVPTIYFAPGAGHTLDLQPSVGADAYGLDWRLPIDEAWDILGNRSVQGNLDPAVLLTDGRQIRAAVGELLDRTAGRPGHIVNLGHGIDRRTPVEHVHAFVESVRA